MTDSNRTRSSTAWLNVVLAATALVSAWLLFQIQPMVAKRILPWFGGGSAVWTTTMLFFQTALFAGYLYAHMTARLLTPRRQVFLHITLLAAAAASLLAVGVVPNDYWKPEGSGQPGVRILALLAACVGLPYLMLAATAPLVQVWFSRANPSRSPYRLYALSNAGSLAALLSYPLLLEPNFGLAQQGIAWSLLFFGFAMLCATSGALALRHGVPHLVPGRAPLATPVLVPERKQSRYLLAEPVAPNSEHADNRPGGLQLFFWLALPACASLALLAITSHLSQDVAPIPLLWIVPMTVYLLTFILTFDSDRWYRRVVWLPLGAVATYAAAWNWSSGANTALYWRAAADLTLLLTVGMACHGELARMRPHASRLTAYYLCIAAGGALGGLLAAVVAPLAFNDHYELPLGILAAWFLALAALVSDRRSPFYDGRNFAGLLGMAVLFVALATVMYQQVAEDRRDAIDVARNFYGALRVELSGEDDQSAYLGLTNGIISHGGQFRQDVNRRVPMWYYHPDSGIGQALTSMAQGGRRIGVVGLGAGTLAAYGEAGDEFRFFEINPQVTKFADRYFTYLRDARERGTNVKVIHGDARLSLERLPPQEFDVLVLDAFNSDAVPVHLLTLEAFALYLRHIKDPQGVVAVHVTNQHLDLPAVVQAAADHFDLEATLVVSVAGEPGTTGTEWMFLQHRPAIAAQQNVDEPSAPAKRRLKQPWTDDFSNLLGILK